MHINVFHIIIGFFIRIKQSIVKVQKSLYEGRFIKVKAKDFIKYLYHFAQGGGQSPQKKSKKNVFAFQIKVQIKNITSEFTFENFCFIINSTNFV